MQKHPRPLKSRKGRAATTGAGSTSLSGYEYQIDVSLWLALDLVLASKLAHEVILEPCSQEDLEADLDELEPGRQTSAVPMDGYRLVVQAKLRSGDAWTVPAMRALLQHGSDTRPSAAKRLIDPGIRYLLVTSAALNSGVKAFGIRRAGNWPKDANLPRSLSTALPADAGGRVAIIGNQDEERLATDIQRLLTENFRVPYARWQQCRKELREAARIRIRGGSSGRWQRDDLERIIRSHEGYIASSPELDHYVYPTNWNDLTSAMIKNKAALVVGQSGTGKTLATKKLFEELRARIPGLSRVPITLGPHQLRDDQTDPPVLYDIEDPWGRYDFDPNSRPWNDQLAGILARSRHDCMVIATSRRDVAQASGALESVKRWVVNLEAEHYGPDERRSLYLTRIDGLPRAIQVVATQAEATVLRQLATPLEIQKFFDALPNLDRSKFRKSRLIAEAVRQAHHDAIEQTVIEQISQRSDIRAAAVVWGLLKANSRLSLRALRLIEERLADRHTDFERGIEPLVAFFVAARNLRQTEDAVSYYHPRVESGMERALTANRLVARKALQFLVEELTSADGPDPTWGTGTAVRLLEAADHQPGLKPSLSLLAQAEVDRWLTAQTPEGGPALEAHLRQAAAAGSRASVVSELARYLLHQPDADLLGLMCWKPPEREEAWYTRLRSQRATAPLLRAFVLNVLPSTRTRYPLGFAMGLRRLAPPLTDAFVAAAAEVVHQGVIGSDDAIAEGALEDIDSFEAIVDVAVDVLTPTDEEKERVRRERLKITNGEYSDEYADHLMNDDEGFTAGEFLKAYITRVRSTFGWRRIAEHRHAEHLLYYWLRDLADHSRKLSLDPQELESAIHLAIGHQHEDMAWRVLQQRWQPENLDRLVDRLRLGHSEADVRQAALACLIAHEPQRLAPIIRGFTSDQKYIRAAGIAVDLAELYAQQRHSEDGSLVRQGIEAAIALLPLPLGEIANAAIALQRNEVPALSTGALTYLAAISGGETPLRRFMMNLSRHVPLHVEDDIRWLLANVDDDLVAVEAVEAAARRGMTMELEAALDHRFARASAHALCAIAASKPAPLSAKLLAMADAKGSHIRKALVEALDAKPHPSHLSALLQLAEDTWSTSWTSHGEESRFPIAQTAVDAIAKLGPLAPDSAERLWKIAIETADRQLCRRLFEVIAELSDCFRDQLFELAITPGRLRVRSSAAIALLSTAELASETLVARITPELLLQQEASIAALLTLIWALRAEPKALVQKASEIVSHPKRRALVLLVVLVLNRRDAQAAAHVAELLPNGHVSRRWALGDQEATMDDITLADLGDPMVIGAVLPHVATKRETK